jgi:hypothetical protein
LLVALAATWLVTQRRASGSTMPSAPALTATTTNAATTTTTTSASRPVDTQQLRTLLDPALRCTDVIAPVPAVHCSSDRVSVDAWLLTLAGASARYRAEIDVSIMSHTGAPACERGIPEERAWARPATPGEVAGRYQCRIEGGRAAMWWTDGALLAHAVATDDNLGALFAWWRALPGG